VKDAICLVTGATAGIGYVTASSLAARGATVIVGGRSKQKAEATVDAIHRATGNNAVEYLIVEFSDLSDVKRATEELKHRFNRLDRLINNAGAFYNTRQMTSYGVEKTFLVNYLAPFLLTNELLELLESSASSRIINVTSEAHRYDEMDFADLSFEVGYSGMKAYARSKLANVMFTYELARRLDQRSITVNAVHPGHVATDIWRTNFSFFGPFLKWVMGFFALSPEEGADNSIFLATAAEVEGITGKYFIKREVSESSPLSQDVETARRLWEISEGICYEGT
jgi:NAD(P)-dependent dehydrogenase (short-subunit alcohol dehydrogenase family)